MTATVELTTADTLRRAASTLTEHGWAQREYLTTAGEMCLVTAVGATVNGAATDRFRAALDAIRQVTGAVSVTEWNDTPGRTETEVLDALTRAADLAEKGTPTP